MNVSSRWSRFWGAIGAAAFWLALGAAALDAAVIAPLWTVSPPASVRAWADLALRPEPERFFLPLAAVLALAMLLAWLADLGVRGARRWWLTLALLAAFAAAWASALELRPIERMLVAAAADDDLRLVTLAHRWLQWSLLRFGAFAAGGYAAHRAHLAGVLARRQGAQSGVRDGAAWRAELRENRREMRTKQPRRRREDFVWSEDDDRASPRHRDF